jgi:hypothetical protein
MNRREVLKTAGGLAAGQVFDSTKLDHPGTNRRRADPEAIIDAIERPREGDLERSAHRDTLPRLDLPGFGDALDDCGDDLPHFCSSCGATFAIGRTCNRSQCPRCCLAWARVRASKICGKLDALRRYKYASGTDNQFFHHLAISLPEDWSVAAGEDPQDALERTLEVVKEILDELGIEGVVFYHPWRGVDGDDRGAWKGRIGSFRPWSDRDDVDGSRASPFATCPSLARTFTLSASPPSSTARTSRSRSKLTPVGPFT